jgi:hypothetical protein
MTTFSATEAAMSGFRFAFKRPLIVLAWAGITIVASIVVFGVMMLLMFPTLSRLSTTGSQDPAAIEAMMMTILPIYLVLLPLGLLWAAVQQTAVNRFILKPEDRGFAYLKVGGDEWRQILLILLSVVVLIGWGVAWFAVTFILGMLTQIWGSTVGGIVNVLAQLALAAFFIFAVVRLSLASVMTFQSQRVTLFGSWAATRGRFWPLLGTYLLTFLLVIAAAFAIWILFAIIMVLGVGGSMAGLSAANEPEAMAKMMTPTVIILYLLILPVTQIVSVVINMAALAPPADVYRQMNPAASVFD